jgi:hypothetical protein
VPRWVAGTLAAVAVGALAPAVHAAPPTPLEITRAYLEHERTGSYQAFELLPRDWRSPYPLDRHGVPLVQYASGPAYNPVTTAQYGLAQWTIGRRFHARPRIRVALRMADWLVRRQEQSSGTWLYRFDYTAPGAGLLRRPWSSALAQGQALSLLRRAYHRTGARRYLDAIGRALRPLRISVPRGGLLRRWHGLPFYEEYPTAAAPTYVLNGFQQTLLGLYDVADVSPVAARLFGRGIKTLVCMLPLYDLGDGRSTYSLAHLYWASAPQPATPSYHLSHVGMLLLLNRIEPDPVLRRYARRWRRSLAGAARRSIMPRFFRPIPLRRTCQI